MLHIIVLTAHVMACAFMILFVLLQTGRGAGLGVLGGGGGDLINTPTGSSFMKKFTAGLAATFAFTSLFLTLLQSRTGLSTVTNEVTAPLPAASAPAQPAAPAPAPAPAKKK
jgi:preprotein translocase subunit SecG